MEDLATVLTTVISGAGAGSVITGLIVKRWITRLVDTPERVDTVERQVTALEKAHVEHVASNEQSFSSMADKVNQGLAQVQDSGAKDTVAITKLLEEMKATQKVTQDTMIRTQLDMAESVGNINSRLSYMEGSLGIKKE